MERNEEEKTIPSEMIVDDVVITITNPSTVNVITNPSTVNVTAIPKFIFVKDITAKTPVFTDYFLVTASAVRQAKNGNKFVALTLGDKTGTLDAKFWDYIDGGPVPAVNDFVKVEAAAQEYKDAVQLTIRRWRTVEDVRIEDFLPMSKRDGEEMFAEVLQYAEATEAYKSIVLACLAEHSEEFKVAPAAKSNHQCYLSGLQEHVLGLCKLATSVCDQYPQLDRGLLLATAILHDIGKVRELEYSRAIKYSRAGSLLGHLAIGLQLVAKHADLLPSKEYDLLCHMIASHHGRTDWGAIKIPMTREALVFHSLDMIEARIHTADIVGEDAGYDGFTPWSKAFDGPLYVPDKDKCV